MSPSPPRRRYGALAALCLAVLSFEGAVNFKAMRRTGDRRHGFDHRRRERRSGGHRFGRAGSGAGHGRRGDRGGGRGRRIRDAQAAYAGVELSP